MALLRSTKNLHDWKVLLRIRFLTQPASNLPIVISENLYIYVLWALCLKIKLQARTAFKGSIFNIGKFLIEYFNIILKQFRFFYLSVPNTVVLILGEDLYCFYSLRHSERQNCIFYLKNCWRVIYKKLHAAMLILGSYFCSSQKHSLHLTVYLLVVCWLNMYSVGLSLHGFGF